MNDASYTAPPEIDQLQRWSLVIGVVALALCVAEAFFNPTQFFRSYLLGYLFWLGIPLGCLAIVMLHHLSGGGWGLMIRRVLESATRTIPLMIVLALPLALGLNTLYVWARPEEFARHAALQHKRIYLNVPFFLMRAALYFAVWIVVAHYINKWSLEQDRTMDPSLTRRLQILSGPGLVLYGVTVTFASIDWIMSLEPEWSSTIFGVIVMGGQGLAAMAFAIILAHLLAKRGPLLGIISSSHFHDLGKILLAFVMLWAYFAFSQLLIIWSGNLPEEVPWYLHRLQGGWQWVGVSLILFHLGVPFLLLLSQNLKRNAVRLAMVASAVIVMHFVDLIWLVVPEFHQSGFHIHWMDFMATIGLGGVWSAYFARQLKDRPLLPLRDPYLQEALNHGRD